MITSTLLNGETITLTSGSTDDDHSLRSPVRRRNLTINGDGQHQLGVQHQHRAVASTSVTISGLTITGGHARDIGGGGIDATASPSSRWTATSSPATKRRSAATVVRRRWSLRQRRDGERVQQYDHQQHHHVQRLRGGNGPAAAVASTPTAATFDVTGSDVSHNTVDRCRATRSELTATAAAAASTSNGGVSASRPAPCSTTPFTSRRAPAAATAVAGSSQTAACSFHRLHRSTAIHSRSTVARAATTVAAACTKPAAV